MIRSVPPRRITRAADIQSVALTTHPSDRSTPTRSVPMSAPLTSDRRFTHGDDPRTTSRNPFGGSQSTGPDRTAHEPAINAQSTGTRSIAQVSRASAAGIRYVRCSRRTAGFHGRAPWITNQPSVLHPEGA